MNLSLYARLAADNIRKQRRLYAPYRPASCALASITPETRDEIGGMAYHW